MTLFSKTKLTLVGLVITLTISTLNGCTKLNRMTAMPTAPLSPFQDQSVEEDTREHAIVVCIPAEGKFYVGREPVNFLDDLRGLLLRRLNQKPAYEKVVYIKASKTVKSGESAKVAEIVRSVGAVPKLLRR
ncbi:MAG: hypothetical protein ABI977_22755 [Acidobacteriota bacterium]